MTFTFLQPLISLSRKGLVSRGVHTSKNEKPTVVTYRKCEMRMNIDHVFDLFIYESGWDTLVFFPFLWKQREQPADVSSILTI